MSREVSRFVIGTAGHVDHGKTTLVRALTGVETDRLVEEKRRGISIELGFAPWTVAPGILATIIDVPGHRRLVHTMIAGASGIQLVLMVIAADEGVMPQTREHALVCAELGIRHALVVLTKTDRVDRETIALAEIEARELLADRFEVDVVACSALTGDGMDAVRERVAACLACLPQAPVRGPARLGVDRVLHVRGAGVVVTGTLVSGAIEQGEALVLLGPRGSRATSARELHIHDSRTPRAISPTRLAVNLPLDASDVERGDLLTTDTRLSMTQLVDAVFRGRIRRSAELAIHVGTARSAVRVTRVEDLGDGEQLIRLVLPAPLPLAGGDRFILRGAARGSGSIAGGGTVLDARPSPRARRQARRTLARALSFGDTNAVLSSLLLEASPCELSWSALDGRLAHDTSALAAAAELAVEEGRLVHCGDGVIAKESLTTLADDARAMVKQHLRRAPLDRGLPVATLLQTLASIAGTNAANAAILMARAKRSAHDEDAIRITGDIAVLAKDDLPVHPAIARAREQASHELERAGVRGVSAVRMGEITASKPDDVRALLASLERSHVAVRAGDLWFSTAVVDALQELLVNHLAKAGRVTVIEWKDLAHLPRNQAVALLEYFDQRNVTRRVGDSRVPGTGLGFDAAR